MNSFINEYSVQSDKNYIHKNYDEPHEKGVKRFILQCEFYHTNSKQTRVAIEFETESGTIKIDQMEL